MFEFAALTYGLLASIVLSSLGRNHRQRKPHPALLRTLGYLLCGISAGTSFILFSVAVRRFLGI